MKLNGIHAAPGTVIGVDMRSLRFVVADVCSLDEMESGSLPLCYATAEQISFQALMREPRSVAEHHGIRRTSSSYGLVRQFKPSPRVR
jgi:hypothetical protein